MIFYCEIIQNIKNKFLYWNKHTWVKNVIFDSFKIAGIEPSGWIIFNPLTGASFCEKIHNFAISNKFCFEASWE